MRRLRRTQKLASVSVFVVLARRVFPFPAPLAMAQATTGGLKGIVTDVSGAVVPDADVTVKNDGTGVENKTKTNGDGLYTFPKLSPGNYTITITRQNFKTQTFQQVTVSVGQELTIDAALQEGTITTGVSTHQTGGETRTK